MKGDCFDGDGRNMGDFLRRAALCDELQNLPLPRAEAKDGCRARRIPEPLQMLAR